MSATKHTPGPWRVSGGSPTLIKRDFREIGSEEGELIASAHGHPNSGFFPDEAAAIANARLIAAAPDLLAALQGLDEAYCRAGAPLTRAERHEDRQRLVAARAAVAKATAQ